MMRVPRMQSNSFDIVLYLQCFLGGDISHHIAAVVIHDLALLDLLFKHHPWGLHIELAYRKVKRRRPRHIPIELNFSTLFSVP